MDILALILFFAPVGLFVIHAWRVRGRLAARDRWALITSITVAFTMFVIAPLLINWVIVPTIIWLIAIALFAGGVLGATLVSCSLLIGMAVI